MAQAGMMIPPDPQFFDNSGTRTPLAGGIIYFYAAGTTTPKAVYGDSGETVVLGTSVTLDAAGRAKIWLDGYYYCELYDALGNLIWTEDDVSSAYFPATSSSPSSILDEWILQSDALTYVGATQFTIPGDKTSVYVVGRRIKATVTAGTITGTITVSSSGGSPIKTTVTVRWDLAEALDAGLSAVWVGIISPVASGTPYQIPIGSVIDWYKSMPGVPALSYGWVQCDGQTLSDPLSPMNGQVIPNMNGAAAGADTFSNSKIAPFTRGASDSGNYFADAIIAHGHGVSAITANSHNHPLTGGTANAAATDAGHLHNVKIEKAISTVQSGSGTSNLWQNGTNSPQSQNSDSSTASISLSGHTDVASANGLTGTTDNNGAATETVPKYVTVVKIMRTK